MNNPTPRDSNFMGMKSVAHIQPDGTWLEPEEITYPSGGFHRRAYVFLRKNQHNPISLPYGEKRVVRCAVADSFFTIPARFKYKGRTIKGYISSVDDVMTFTPEASDDCPMCEPGRGCKKSQN